MDSDSWDDLDMRASQILLLLAKNVLANVSQISSAKEFWEKLESLYLMNSRSNRLFLKDQFYTLKMSEGTSIANHLSILNSIYYELEALGVKVEDEDKALRLLLSLLPSYKYLVMCLNQRKEAFSLTEVTGALLPEEKNKGVAGGSYFNSNVGCGGGVMVTGDGSELLMRGVSEIHIRMFNSKV
ncbi:hypothetical protein BVC80_1749g15 [Macleaya cordata]|uniref:Retrovirus-related Pol polyprotein from transposon TNT 1-94 n=1 Tax=Macleaya cordata TaxID=56857 RepID=A0A200QL42_MACCD|nr:hypothetical protein BVC80_1749g15 [Macleaya cordata]